MFSISADDYTVSEHDYRTRQHVKCTSCGKKLTIQEMIDSELFCEENNYCSNCIEEQRIFDYILKKD